MFFMGFDPTFVLLIPAMIFAFWAQWKVQSTYQKMSRVRAANGMTGREMARSIMNRNGLSGVDIEQVEGVLPDHYDPRAKKVRLTDNNYQGDSLASIAVAAHEVGHALQHAKGYAPMRWRWSLLGPANLGSTLAMPLAFIGILMGSGGIWLLDLGIILFSAVVLFQVVTLPVEFNASSRAYAHLTSVGIATPDEAAMAKKVLDAAALTYVASAATALLSLLRLILLRNSRD